jgi:hypothetical protein
MTPQAAKNTLDKIVGQIFGYQNPYSLEQFMQKYAFDVRLPIQVNDSTTSEATWSQSANPTRYITMKNAHNRSSREDWIRAKRQFASMEEVLAAWSEVNMTTTEREIDSLHVAQSDNVYSSENVFRSQDVIRSKNILFCDGATDCEYVAASQRSNTSNYGLRLEDSQECTSSFSVIWSGKIVNCMFLEDCFDMFECLFCSHLTSRKFCIANMQFEEAEYRKVKDMIARWVLTP